MSEVKPSESNQAEGLRVLDSYVKDWITRREEARKRSEIDAKAARIRAFQKWLEEP